ncbi:MAG TPA: nicotinate-nucleotide adenylyltransferase, partial [Elusimicrobiota bacterium]|nr:nicotinate-nucleotide adenylyltransferase [Elusimicrobiota bacterium]
VVLVGARKGEKGVRPPRGFADRIRFLRGPLPRVSSTAIRDRLARGRSLRGLTPAPVAAYIRRRGLYRP